MPKKTAKPISQTPWKTWLLLLLLIMASIGGLAILRPTIKKKMSSQVPSGPVFIPSPSPELRNHPSIQAQNARFSLLEKPTTYILDSFTLQLPADEYYGKVYDKQVQVRISGADPEEMAECTRVKNVHQLFTYLYDPEAIEVSSGPFFFAEAWSSPKIIPINRGSENDIKKVEDALANVLSQPDGPLPIVKSMDFKISALLSCGGGWFYPTYKQTLVDPRFKQVVYIEVNAGNGLPYSNPTRLLIAESTAGADQHWLILSESAQPSIKPAMTTAMSQCESNEQAELIDNVKCVAQVWNAHRDQAAVTAWTRAWLSKIKPLTW